MTLDAPASPGCGGAAAPRVEVRRVPTVMAILAGLLVAELCFALAFWLGWLVVLLSLIVGGVAVTSGLLGLLAVEVERASLQLVTGWSPSRARLVLSGWPVAVAVVAVHGAAGPRSWDAYAAAVAIALVARAITLRYLAGGDGGRIDRGARRPGDAEA